MLRHVLFDLYGTLVRIVTDEGAPQTAEAFERWLHDRFGASVAAREREHPFLKDLRAMRTSREPHSEPDLAPVVRSHLERVAQREVSPLEVQETAGAFRACSRRQLQLIPGSVEALASLRRRFGVGLVSNAQVLFTRPELEQLGMPLSGFSPAVISSEIGVRKPARRIFAVALARAGVRADEALFVGNDPWDDVEGAAAAGLHTCLVEDPLLEKEVRVPPELALRSVADLPAALFDENAPPWARGR
jgi:putative hydrolase of the HAD superfamily